MLDLGFGWAITAVLVQAPRSELRNQLQLSQTTELVTFLPSDIRPPYLGQVPSGMISVRDFPLERLANVYTDILSAAAHALPSVDRDADHEVGMILKSLEKEDRFRDINSAFEHD